MKSEVINDDNGLKLQGIDAISRELGKSIATVMKYIRDFDLPATRGADSIWCMDVGDFRAWAADWGFSPKTADSDLELVQLRKHLEQAGAGRVITGDLAQVADRLHVSQVTLTGYRALAGCPLEKTDGNQFKIDLNAWELFRLQNRLPPYEARGKAGKENRWS